VIHATTGNGDMIYTLAPDGTLRSRLHVGFGHLAQTRDGRVAFVGDSLRELDPATGSWGDIISDTEIYVWDMHSAPGKSVFDLYFDIVYDDGNDIWLYGYNLSTGVLTPLINWSEMSFLPDDSQDHMGFLADGRIALFHQVRDSNHQIRTDLLILTPEG